MKPTDWLAIGDLAKRTGAAISAIRFYEEKGLLHARRNAGGQRRFLRSDIRRISFILIAQKLGFSLEDIRRHLAELPSERTPTARDWEKISRSFRHEIDERITRLTALRDTLTSCIGCGCLSLKRCRLYNPGDEAAEKGAGARYLLGDRPSVSNRAGK